MNILIGWRLIRATLHIFAGMAICALVFPWIGRERRNGHVRRWSGQLLAICGVRVEKAGGAMALEHAMIVANHVSWLDIFVINSLLPCRFVAKSEIRSWPMLGWLAAQAGTVFIARGNRRDLRHVFKGLVENLHLGERIAFFPEGTTAAQGTLLPFHANLFEAAVDAEVPVQPYALSYHNAKGELHAAVDFTGDMTLAQSMVAIFSGGLVTARLVCAEPISVAGMHRRDLAERAHGAVARALNHTQ